MRWIVTLLLLIASVLKSRQFFADASAAPLLPIGRWLLPFEIGVEFGVGFLASTGLFWRQVRWIALLLFAGFAIYSLQLTINGAKACGCLGTVQIHPLWMFILDAAVVLGLSWSMLRPKFVSDQVNAQLVLYPGERRYLLVTVAGMCVLVSAFLVRYFDHPTAIAEGMLPTMGGPILLEPEQWLGKSMPIAEFIDVDVSGGDWTLLLYRHDCADCGDVVSHCERLTSMGANLALIEVPPYGPSPPSEAKFQFGRLSDDRDWFVRTPVEIRLVDGLVVAVRGHEH